MTNIREYYMENFPTDELGIEINENATFEGLAFELDNWGDIYEYIGVGDSMVRERLFWALSQITATPYNDLYAKWLLAP